MDGTESTVEKAINASRPEMGTQIQDSRQSVRDVSESQDEYCDTTAQANIVLGQSSSSGSVDILTDGSIAVDPGQGSPKLWVPAGMSQSLCDQEVY